MVKKFDDRFTLSMEYGREMDGQTDGRTDRHPAMAQSALRGKNKGDGFVNTL